MYAMLAKKYRIYPGESYDRVARSLCSLKFQERMSDYKPSLEDPLHETHLREIAERLAIKVDNYDSLRWSLMFLILQQKLWTTEKTNCDRNVDFSTYADMISYLTFNLDKCEPTMLVYRCLGNSSIVLVRRVLELLLSCNVSKAVDIAFKEYYGLSYKDIDRIAEEFAPCICHERADAMRAPVKGSCRYKNKLSEYATYTPGQQTISVWKYRIDGQKSKRYAYEIEVAEGLGYQGHDAFGHDDHIYVFSEEEQRCSRCSVASVCSVVCNTLTVMSGACVSLSRHI